MAAAIDTSSSGAGFIRGLALCAGAVAVVLFLVDILVAGRLESSSLATDVIDIQTPSAFAAKARRLAEFRGKKIILLGDSLVAGQVMREHGDTKWRRHTLSALLQRHFDRTERGKTLVMNLGMNGIQPADLETQVEALLPMQPDVIVIDISLRSFSKDFAAADKVYSRPWLRPGLALDAKGQLLQVAGEGGLGGALDRALFNSWITYRIRDMVRSRLLQGEPRDLAQGLRTWLESAGASKAIAGPAAEMRLLLQVRGRYASATLEPGNPQLDAWGRMLSKLEAAGQRAIVFYATESPRLLPSLIDREDYDRLLAELDGTVRRHGGERVTYLAANPGIPDEMFLDHVHVDVRGNRIYAESLLQAMARR
jgi:hypothetical protein